MQVARVVGNIWATRKHKNLSGSKLLLVRALESMTGKAVGDTQMAVDNKFGAGPGDTVLLLDEGSSARQIMNDKGAPVRLVVCGIVDSVCSEGREKKYH